MTPTTNHAEIPTPRADLAAGYPTTDWQACAERLFNEGQKLERELSIALSWLAELEATRESNRVKTAALHLVKEQAVVGVANKSFWPAIDAAIASSPSAMAAKLAELRAAVEPIVALIATNDSDTLSLNIPDSCVVARAFGLCVPEVTVTLGQLREIARAARSQSA